jgi:hypothetical protein
MKMHGALGSSGVSRAIEILSEDEEYYVAVVRKILECIRRSSGANADLRQVECALLAAGASSLAEEADWSSRSFSIRGVKLAVKKCTSEDHKIELRFENTQR